MSEHTPARPPIFEVIKPPFEVTNYSAIDPDRGGLHVGSGGSSDYRFPHHDSLQVNLNTAFTSGTPKEAQTLVLGRTSSFLPQDKPPGLLIDVTSAEKILEEKGSTISRTHGIVSPIEEPGKYRYRDSSTNGTRVHRLIGFDADAPRWESLPLGNWDRTKITQEKNPAPTETLLGAVNIIEFPTSETTKDPTKSGRCFLYYRHPDASGNWILIPVESPTQIPEWLKAQVKSADPSGDS